MNDQEREVREFCMARRKVCEVNEGLLARALLAAFDVDKGRKFEAKTAVILGKHRERMIAAVHAALGLEKE